MGYCDMIRVNKGNGLMWNNGEAALVAAGFFQSRYQI